MAETNGNAFLHFFGSMSLTALMVTSCLTAIRSSTIRAFYLVASLCIGAELTRLLIGRGLQLSDLLLGILVSFMAYLMIMQSARTRGV